MEFYLHAFFELCTERVWSGAPIPWSSIVEYADRYEFVGTDFEDFRSLIRSLDTVLLKRGAKKDGDGG